MTRYEQGFLNKCAEYGVDEGLAKQALFHWTHHLVPWETKVELNRKAGRAIFAAENGRPGLARYVMKRKYKDDQVEELLAALREIVNKRKKTQDAVNVIKTDGVFPKRVEGNPFKK